MKVFNFIAFFKSGLIRGGHFNNYRHFQKKIQGSVTIHKII